jgi:hypothetical protein
MMLLLKFSSGKLQVRSHLVRSILMKRMAHQLSAEAEGGRIDDGLDKVKNRRNRSRRHLEANSHTHEQRQSPTYDPTPKSTTPSPSHDRHPRPVAFVSSHVPTQQSHEEARHESHRPLADQERGMDALELLVQEMEERVVDDGLAIGVIR